VTIALPGGSIRVDGVGKRYVKYEDSPTLVYGLMRSWQRKRRDRLWALRDVSFDVQPGESVGILGRNGSGKTTLMSMLCGVTGPTTGRLQVAGRIAPLIAVGVGFHPELTGRENVYVNATILGLTKPEIDARLEEIIDFAEVEAFIDTPVKFYSSGMFLRLGFSVAAHVSPDVLLIDEILAVGDVGFQIKCFQHMKRLRAEGVTIMMVSHNLPALEAYCDRGLVIDRGELVKDAPITESVAFFNDIMHTGAAAMEPSAHRPDEIPLEFDAVEVVHAAIYDDTDQPATTFETGDRARLRIEVRAKRAVPAPFLCISVLSQDGVLVYRDYNVLNPYPPMAEGELATIGADVPLRLATGHYQVSYMIGRGSEGATATADPEANYDLATNMTWLTGDQRFPIYVRGRPGADGLADLAADFPAG
jgi:ABC-type polysaccharide/polyol phosphate transport system ATPase subunit